MNIEIMKHILGRVDRQSKLENSHVILFLDNAPSYPEPLQDPPEFFKLVYLPKNATSKLEPADIGVIRNVKAKYIKLLVRHVSSLLSVKNTALTIVSWDEVNESTIRNYFKKCGFSQVESVTEEAQDNAGFQDLLQLFTTEVTAEEYLSFDDNVETHEEAISTT